MISQSPNLSFHSYIHIKVQKSHVCFYRILSSVQSLSHVWLFATSWSEALQASLSSTNTQSLPKLMSIELVMPSNHLILCNPLLLLPSIFPSIRVFQMSQLFTSGGQRLEFQLQYQSSNEYSGLIPLRIDWFDLYAMQGTLKSLFQHYNSKASILLCSAFFIVQLSHPYMTRKNHSLD